MDVTKFTKELEQVIDDFLTEHNLSLQDNDTGAAIQPPGYNGEWNVSRSWMGEDKDYKTLRGAIGAAKRS